MPLSRISESVPAAVFGFGSLDFERAGLLIIGAQRYQRRALAKPDGNVSWQGFN